MKIIHKGAIVSVWKNDSESKMLVYMYIKSLGNAFSEKTAKEDSQLWPSFI